MRQIEQKKRGGESRETSWSITHTRTLATCSQHPSFVFVIALYFAMYEKGRQDKPRFYNRKNSEKEGSAITRPMLLLFAPPAVYHNPILYPENIGIVYRYPVILII